MDSRVSVYGAAVAVQVLLSIGQALLKTLAIRIRESGWDALVEWSKFIHVATPVLAIGFLYFIAIVLWLYVLGQLPINRAFPFVSLTFVFMPLIAHFFAGETVSPGTIVGACLIVPGILIGVFL